jgi:Stage II sporulation protein E (SpoIIE)
VADHQLGTDHGGIDRVPLGAPASGAALVVRASHSATFVVAGIATDSRQGVGYALANPKNSTFTVYAERAIPANRRVPVESDSAFADLHFATYLGPTTNLSALQTTDVATSHLPLTSDTARASIPFGDTTITLVTSPTGHLGGTIGAELPWLVVIVGLLLTAVTAFVAGRLVGRRRDTERDAQTITGLYERLDTLFAEQRTISETLQHALLPQRNPLIPNLEVASRYVAGAHGVDIGGDWYSIIQLDESRFGFVVGDVSGRGVDAATHMARIRFTLRAYLIEGHPPNVALELCARQLNIDVDGHFATVVIGTGDLTSQVVTLANAGHLNPLLITGRGAQVVETKVGPPLGVTTAAYELTTFAMEPGSTLMAFTDGLIERRDADIDLGFERLADAATTSTGRSVDDMLSAVLSVMSDYTGAEDDIAILAFRWTAPGPSSAPESLERPSSDLTSLTQ